MSYNGWTNYETWRVNLEVFDGWSEDELCGEMAESIADDVYLDGVDNELNIGIIGSFLRQVNWHEIAKHHSEDKS